MADIITRLKLESGEYDSRIKRAVTGLQQMETECRKVGGTLAILEKDQKQYVQALGQMQTVSTSVRGKISELSNAFVELRAQYNRLTDEEKKGDFGRALSASLDNIKDRIKDARKELQGIQEEMNGKPSTSLFSRMGDKMTGAMQVFAGNMMTKATMAVADFGSELVGMVQQGVELAKAGEGIRIAFERLGRGDILAGLREATHGTVTDLELMKAAVKFNDFKLPLDQLGTMLAFAQQKAKDTGQSVDYMVDSIVTGLGRKSLMILDNLGLSAAEVKEEMKKTGDMTVAVGNIIKRNMKEAGDYIETAADRAAQANVDMQNKLEELGRKFAPVEEASAHLWTSMKIGILDIIGGPLATLLNQLTEAGRRANALKNLNGGGNGAPTKVQQQLSALRGSNHKQALYQMQLSGYDKQIDTYQRMIDNGGKLPGAPAGSGRDVRWLTAQMGALKDMRAELVAGAKNIFNPVKPVAPVTTPGTIDDKKGGKTTKTKPQLTLEQQTALDVQKAEKGYADALAMAQTKLIENVTTSDEYDKEIQKGQQSLADAYLKAYTATGDEKYLTAYRETADHVKTLQEGIDQHAKAQKEAAEDLKRQSLNLGSTGGIASLISTLKSDQAAQTIGSTEWEGTSNQLAAATGLNNIVSESLKGGIDPKQIEAITAPLREALSNGIIDKDKLNEEVLNALSDINALLQEQGLEPIKLNLQTGELSNVTKDVKGMSKEWQYAASAIGQVGNAMSQIEDPAAKVLGTIAQAIATVALAASQAIAAKDTTASGWAWIGAAAAITATMVSTIATIHSATGYAQGGIVKGDSYSGDNIPASTFVNAGELVLNRAQQGNLASQLEQGGLQGMNLSAVISGEDILLTVNNRLRREGRGELVTSRSKYIN